jgi:predicted transcriptional regulator
MSTNLLELSSEIVRAQASHSSMTADEMSEAIKKVYKALKWVKDREEKPESEKKAGVQVNGMDSIKRNKVICLECGREFRQITGRHLNQHGITPKEYKKKHKIPLRQGLSAKSLTLKRRATAKERGLGERLAKAREKGKGKKN